MLRKVLITTERCKVSHKNIFHTTEPATEVDCLNEAGLDPRIYSGDAKFWLYHLENASVEAKIHQTKLHFYSL